MFQTISWIFMSLASFILFLYVLCCIIDDIKIKSKKFNLRVERIALDCINNVVDEFSNRLKVEMEKEEEKNNE